MEVFWLQFFFGGGSHVIHLYAVRLSSGFTLEYSHLNSVEMTVICILDVPPKMLTGQPNVAALTSRHLWTYESPNECSFWDGAPPTEPGSGDTPRRSDRGQGEARAAASGQRERESDNAQVIQDALPSSFGGDPQTSTSAQQKATPFPVSTGEVGGCARGVHFVC